MFTLRLCASVMVSADGVTVTTGVIVPRGVETATVALPVELL
jgi:hypothetical protein